MSNKTYGDINKINQRIDGIIFETKWYKYYDKPNIFYGSKRPVVPSELVDISLTLNIKFFGCDLPSVDKSGSLDKPVHNALLGSKIIIYESLANLNCLPELEIFKFIGFPLNLQDLDGSPVRAVGII